MNTRNIILDMLCEIFDEGKLCHYVIGDTLNKYSDIDKQDRSFIKRVCQGVVERKITIDYFISEYSSTRPDKLKPVIRNILRMGVYQVMYMDSIPDSASCNEAVKLTKKRGYIGLSGFVNAVMRSIIKNREALSDISRINNVNKRISIEYSFPEWIIRKWSKVYNDDQIIKTLRYFLSIKGTGIRCNISKGSINRLKEDLTANGIMVTDGVFFEECMKITGYDSLQRMPEFLCGRFCVQDESSSFVGRIAGLKRGDRVLDICAAPGGKTMHAADILLKLGGGEVTACDISTAKTSLIEENISCCGFSCINVIQNDGLIYNNNMRESADVVIADVPCSGLGIIGRKPDIKYNISEEKQSELIKLQRGILTNAVRYVKHGGILIFSTCTVNTEENEENVRFLVDELECSTESLDDFIPAVLHNQKTAKGMLQLFPGIHGTDGFFVSRLRVWHRHTVNMQEWR